MWNASAACINISCWKQRVRAVLSRVFPSPETAIEFQWNLLQRQSRRSMGVLPGTSKLIKWFCVENCKHTDAQERRQLWKWYYEGKEKLKKEKKNDAQEIIFFKSRRLIIDRCMYSQSKAEFKMQKAQSMACNTNPQEHLSTHPTLNILLNWSEQNPCLTTLLFVLMGETWDNPKMLSFETFQIIKLHIGDSVSVAVYIYRKCRIKSYFYLLIP